jgi:hypothetical protein
MERITLKLAETSHLGRAGEVVTLALQPADVHDPTELSTYLAGFGNGTFRADEASPVILMDNDSDKYRNFNSDDTFRRVDVKGSVQGAIPEVDPSTVLNTYKVVDRMIGSFIPRRTELQTGNNYRPREAAARRCKRAILIDREYDIFATLLGTTTNFAAANRFVLGANANWGLLTTQGEGTASDPMFDVQNGMVTSAQMVTDTWFNPKTAFAFLRHSKVRNHMRQMLGDQAVQQSILAVQEAQATGTTVDFIVPGLPPFRVAGAKGKTEATGALDYILADGVALGLVRPPGVPQDGEEIATTYTFRARGPSGVGFETREFFVDLRGPNGGTMVVASMADIGIMTGNTCGFIITNALV